MIGGLLSGRMCKQWRSYKLVNGHSYRTIRYLLVIWKYYKNFAKVSCSVVEDDGWAVDNFNGTNGVTTLARRNQDLNVRIKRSLRKLPAETPLCSLPTLQPF